METKKKIAPGYYLFIEACPKGPVKGYHFWEPLMKCDSVRIDCGGGYVEFS